MGDAGDEEVGEGSDLDCIAVGSFLLELGKNLSLLLSYGHCSLSLPPPPSGLL